MKRHSTSFVSALMLAAVTWLGASTASAQSLAQPRSWTVTPFLSTSAGLDISKLDVDPLLNESLGIGVAIGYDLTHNLGFEGEIGHLFDVAGETDNIDWSVSTFSANAIYHFDVKRVTPYATFGIGLERSGYDLKATDPLELTLDPSSTEIAINFGGGVKYALDNRWVVRGDLRRFQANDIAPDYWRIYGGLTYVITR